MSKKLLLADDSITIQKVIGITFANEDYALSVVDNGDAALDKARTEQPDLILADVFMPGKNGYELCAAIKAQAPLRHIPVLLLAGTFEPFDEAKARKAGADGWIAKPFESQALIDRVEELLARAQVAAAAQPPVPDQAMPAAALAPAPAEDEDTEPDLWAELGPLTAPSVESVETSLAEEIPEELPVATAVETIDGAAIDDLWGEVSLGEEDLGPVTAAQAPVDIWQDLDAPAAASAPAVAAEPVRVDDGNLWDELSAAPASSSAPAGSQGSLAAEEEEEVFLTLEDEEASGDLLEPAAGDGEDEEAFIFVEDDELAQDLSEAAAQPVEAAATFVAAEAAEEELLELEEGDILPLDDGDILVEDELELLEEELELLEPQAPLEQVEAAPVDLVAEQAPPLEEADDDLLIGDLPPLEPVQSPAFAEAAVAAEESSRLEAGEPEESPLWDIAEPEPAPAPEVAVEELFEPEPLVAAGEPAPAAAPLSPAPAALSAAAAEAQVQGLSEADLSRIVERVAGEVIERLAGSILERMAWEVVPDLAETLIREEIRKIRESVA